MSAPDRPEQEWPEKDEREPRRLDAQLLSDLWIFRAAARAGSIANAAGELNVTSGAVSQRVLRLEARLKSELFQRQKGRMVLTDAGNTLLDAMNEASRSLNAALARLDRPDRATVVVSCGSSLATEWLMPHLQDFYRECLDVELRVRAETNPATAAWMAAEGVDVRVAYNHGRPDELYEIAAVREVIFPICSRAYLSRLKSLPHEERQVVVMHDTDAWRENEPPRAEWNEWFASAGPGASAVFSIKAEREFNLAYLAYQAASYGQGIAIGRAVSVNSLIKSGKVVPAVDLPPVPSAHYRLLARGKVAPESPTARFSRWMVEALKKTQSETLELIQTADRISNDPA